MTPRPPIHPYAAWDESQAMLQFTPDPIGKDAFWRVDTALDRGFPWLHDASQEANGQITILLVAAEFGPRYARIVENAARHRGERSERDGP